MTYAAGKPKQVANGYDVCTYGNTGQHRNAIDIQGLTVTVVSVSGCWARYQQINGPGKNIPGLGDAAFGYEIGIDVKAGDLCLSIGGLTANEFHGNYAPDTAMAKKILAGLH